MKEVLIFGWVSAHIVSNPQQWSAIKNIGSSHDAQAFWESTRERALAQGLVWFEVFHSWKMR